MMPTCEEYLRKFVGNRLTDIEINNAFKKYEMVRLGFVAQGLTDGLEKRIADKIATDTLDNKLKVIQAKRNAILNRGVLRDIKSLITEKRAEGFSAAKTLRMKFEGIQGTTSGSRESTDTLKSTLGATWTGGLGQDMLKEVPTFFKQITNPEFDKAIGLEMGELKTGGEPGKSNNPDAVKAAKTIQKWKQVARLEYNRRGGNMGEIEGHVVQSHDDWAMLKAGVSAWVGHMYTNLDLEKTFRGIDPNNEAEIKGILAKSYHQLVTGVNLASEEVAPVSQGNPTSLSTRYSHDRVFHFKDHETQMRYHELYGHGSIVGSAINGIQKLAAVSAMMKEWGTNPEIMFKTLKADEKTYLTKKLVSEKDPANIAKLQKELIELDRGDLRAMFDEMTGVANVPARASLAKLGNNIRAGLTMTTLGESVATSSIGDSFNMIATGAYSGQKGLQAMAPVLRMLESIPKKDRQELAFRFGEGMQGFLGSIHAQAATNGSAPGTMSKTLNQYFKWIGVTGWTDHARQAFTRERSAWLGKHVGLGIDELPPPLKEGLVRNGIGDKEWEAIRASGLDLVNGTHYIMPDSIRDLHDDVIATYASDKIHEAFVASDIAGAKTPEIQAKRQTTFDKKKAQLIEDARSNLEMKLRGYFHDETNYGVVIPTAKSRRVSRGAIFGSRGVESGSPVGELVKSIMMYKSFTVANFDNLGRAFQSRNGLQIAGAGIGILAKLVAMNFVGGLVLTYVKDLTKGNWPPKNPFSWDVMSRAAVSGGALGLYGDYLMNAIHQYHGSSGFVGDLAGPEIGTIASTVKTGYDMIPKGKYTKKNGKLGEAIDQILKWTPYANLIIARPVLDAIVFDQIREWSNPGYKQNKTSNLKTNYGQTNLFKQAAKSVYGR